MAARRTHRIPPPLACLTAAVTAAGLPPVASAQSTGPATGPTVPAVSPDLVGRRVDEVRVAGNAQVSGQQILNAVRTHVGDRFDPETVQDDYERVFGLKRFSNVRARVEPDAAGGVAVVFQVSEERLIHAVRFVGNKEITSDDLAKEVDLKAGEAIENFRIALAKRAIDNAYRGKNHPYTHVDVDLAELTRTGDLVFKVTEAQPVTIRNIEFVGRHSFTYDRLKDQIKTTRWYWIFNPGTFDDQQVQQDVGSLRRYYRNHGFFDVRVDRKVIVSPDQTECQIDFLIDEGPRYTVEKVTFTGNVAVPESVLRHDLKLTAGQTFDAELLDLDVKQIVKAYSPLGYIYDPRSSDPDFLRVGRPGQEYPARVVYRTKPGTVELVYEINEGHPFRAGRFQVVTGNAQVAATSWPTAGAADAARATCGTTAGPWTTRLDRLAGVALLQARATIEPHPPRRRRAGRRGTCWCSVKSSSRRPASGAGAAVNSNLGLNGNFSVRAEELRRRPTRRPARIDDLLSDRAFTGAGQELPRGQLPARHAGDQRPASCSPSRTFSTSPTATATELYYRQFIREGWYEQHAGASGRPSASNSTTSTAGP